jgi:hypothetical protein
MNFEHSSHLNPRNLNHSRNLRDPDTNCSDSFILKYDLVFAERNKD